MRALHWRRSANYWFIEYIQISGCLPECVTWERAPRLSNLSLQKCCCQAFFRRADLLKFRQIYILQVLKLALPQKFLEKRDMFWFLELAGMKQCWGSSPSATLNKGGKFLEKLWFCIGGRKYQGNLALPTELIILNYFRYFGWTWRHMWVLFVIVSRPCSKGFFLRVLQFSSVHKNQQFKFQFSLETVDEKSHLVKCSLLNCHFFYLFSLLPFLYYSLGVERHT